VTKPITYGNGTIDGVDQLTIESLEATGHMAVVPCRLVNQTEHHPAQPVHGVAAEIIRIVTVAATWQDKLWRNANRSKTPPVGVISLPRGQSRVG
jgi:hypothetical protein